MSLRIPLWNRRRRIWFSAAALSLLSPIFLIAQPARVLFVSNVKSRLGMESFQRAAKSKTQWKSQQGVVFIRKDALAVYQVQQISDPASRKLLLNVNIIDAHDGHELGALQLPFKEGPMAVLAGRDGKFLVRAGDVLHLYSPKFERLASRDLPASVKAQFDEWQVDVSPSGATVVVARQLALTGEAEIDFLDGNNLQSTKKLKVSHLDRWSASDHFLITADPDTAPGEGEMGVMDFDGHWRRLPTEAESDDPRCPYNMLALENGVIAAFDCDDLVVVSDSGAKMYSSPAQSGGYVAAAAADRNYLAQVMMQPFARRPVILVHDVVRKKIRLQAFVEKENFYLSVSPEGLLATVDDDEVKVFDAVPAAAVANPSPGPGTDTQPQWSLDLREQFGFAPFDRPATVTWMRQQNVVFLSPEKLAVYQVNPIPAAVGRVVREGEVDQGKFSLEVKVLDVQRGHELKSLRFSANSSFSQVIPTHGGKFVVRAGDDLFLYSAEFEKLGTRELPLAGKAMVEGWQAGGSPSGDELVLVHQQIFTHPVSSPGVDMQAQADVEILNAETLQPLKTFTIRRYLNQWSAADHHLITLNPQELPGKQHFGRMSFDGQWSALNPEWDPEGGCHVQMEPLPQDRIVVYGCGNVSVQAADGKKLLSVAETVSVGEASSATGAGDYLAVGFGRYNMRLFRPQVENQNLVRPLRIAVYDLASAKPVMSVPVRSGNAYYAISSSGTLAVVSGPVLAVFQQEP